jgi:hypothetical protein
MSKLTGKVAGVTAASKGIGAAIAGSKNMANVRKGSLGTWEILLSPLLLNQKRVETGRNNDLAHQT